MQWLKDECELAGAIYSASLKLQLASWAWLLMPSLVLVFGQFIPAADAQGPTVMLKPAFDMMRALVPWAAVLVSLKLGATVGELYLKERRRLLCR